MPVVVIATHEVGPHGDLYEKMIGNMEEVRARGGKVIAVCADGDEHVARIADRTMFVPKMSAFIAPMVTVLPLQLFSYHVADHRGTDVDQPRNLAKSVTVE